MATKDTDKPAERTHDKQLYGISLESVMDKKRLGQALNAKEFAICAGVSYSTARNWFHLPGFPVFRGVTFWDDFVQWRSNQCGLSRPVAPEPQASVEIISTGLPPRAAQLLHDA